MKKPEFVALCLLITPLHLTAGEKAAGYQELVVPNFNAASPPCHVRIPVSAIRCTNKGCDFSPPKSSSLAAIHLTFSCIPITAPTGFENPTSDVEVHSIHTPNATGHFTQIDDPEYEYSSTERARHFDFCLYGKLTTFCGSAKTLLLKDGEAADASGDVLKFVETIALAEPYI